MCFLQFTATPPTPTSPRRKRPSKLPTQCEWAVTPSRVLARERWQIFENSWKKTAIFNEHAVSTTGNLTYVSFFCFAGYICNLLASSCIYSLGSSVGRWVFNNFFLFLSILYVLLSLLSLALYYYCVIIESNHFMLSPNWEVSFLTPLGGRALPAVASSAIGWRKRI